MFDDDDSGMTWLGFQTQNLRLLNTVRSISSAFYAKCDAVVSEINAKDFYGDGKARESCARFLTDQMKELSSWAKHLPAGYKMARRSGEPFSTDRSPAPLDLDYNMPICYQRQRLILELQYHLHALILYRPFICFAPTPETATPLSDSKAASSLSHAMALTYMLHQALTCSEILSGMNQVFRWQSNALFTMLGFSLTYPVSQHTVATRKAIETAITVVETYRFSVPEAAQVVATARNLVKHINAIVIGFRGSIGGKSYTPSPAPSEPASMHTAAPSFALPSCSSRSQMESVGPASPPPAPSKQEFPNFTAMPKGAGLDLRVLQGLDGEDWGDVGALLSRVEKSGNSEPLLSVEEAFGLGGGGMELMRG
ncbi:uncharacterized protein K452DRAFT_208217 [Neofusicoccum parvum]|nr:uncharacterized protein K452DRAFT_208217 [Neofusicoccum parvum]